MPPPVSSGSSRGVDPASGIPNDVLDALLAVANKALECGYDDELDLALVISDTVLAQRRNSRAGWRLRARLMEALGDETEAVPAYERYLGLTDSDGFGVAAKIAGLRVAGRGTGSCWPCCGASARAPRSSPAVPPPTYGPRAWPRTPWGLARGRAAHGGSAPRAGRRGGAGRGPAGTARPVPGVARRAQRRRPARAHRGPRPLRRTAPQPDARPRRRPHHRRRAVDRPGRVPQPGGGQVRLPHSQLGRVGSSSLGAEIDAYDLVVRFNSYRIDARHTGGRTDIHATIHKHGFNWDQQVTTRLVFGGVSGDWKYSLRNRLVPGAQQFLGDESLRWPVRTIGRLGADVWSGIPTTGFNMLFLLDFLDVSPTLDLIGFDFYESGAYRVPEAMKMPITSVHEYTSEKEWVMQRAQRVTDMRISLR
ncbi:hypothetical protein ACR6C2_28705 [Streptomyces sp. INA 01156]